MPPQVEVLGQNRPAQVGDQRVVVFGVDVPERPATLALFDGDGQRTAIDVRTGELVDLGGCTWRVASIASDPEQEAANAEYVPPPGSPLGLPPGSATGTVTLEQVEARTSGN